MLKAAFLASLAKWGLRRTLELGGLLAAILTALSTVDPLVLQKLGMALGALVRGDFDSISLGTIISLIGLIGGLVWNWKSSFGSHVTIRGARVPMDQMPVSKYEVERQAEEGLASKPETVFDRLFKRK